MRLFGLNIGGGGGEDEAAKERREASQHSLEAGGLPLNAIDRLREQASRQNTPQHFFTSDLSVNELMLTRQAGYVPLGQVMGSSVYHVGWQWLPGGVSGEMDTLTRAYYEARHLAIGRLQQEAALLGATGIVGVRLERKEYTWGENMLEFAAIGTAIREADAPPSPGGLPWVSALSGEDFWLLRQNGCRPVGFALGNCTYAYLSQMMSSFDPSQEVRGYTQGIYTARALAMGRMEAEARSVGATGILGAQVETDMHHVESSNGGGYLLFHFVAVGTAIAASTGRWPDVVVQNTVSLG